MLRKSGRSSRIRDALKSGQESNEKKISIFSSEQVNITNSILNKYAHVEFLNNNQEAIVEGCTGIIEYNDNVIRLNTPKFILRFTGRNLQVSCMMEDSIVVRGFILSMEFLN